MKDARNLKLIKVYKYVDYIINLDGSCRCFTCENVRNNNWTIYDLMKLS